jgi:sugar phosphate isomerase/epimerase
MKLIALASFFGPEDMSIPKIAEMGYGGLEVWPKYAPPGDAKLGITTERLLDLCSQYGLTVEASPIGGIDLLSGSKSRREVASRNFRENLKWLNRVNGKIAQCVPGWGYTAFRGYEPVSRGDVVEVLKDVGKVAQDYGVTIALEPCNRFETSYMNTLHDAVSVIEQVGLDSIGISADTYHMDMEEPDPAQGLRDARRYLAHVHLSDNGRLAPGLGSMDIKTIVDTLVEVGYKGALSHFEVKPYPDPETAARVSFDYTKALLDVSLARRAFMKSKMFRDGTWTTPAVQIELRKRPT